MPCSTSSCTASGVPAVRGVHPTRGISLPAQRSHVLLEPGQSHALDQPPPEKSAAASHTWCVQGFWLLTSARKEAFLTSLYKTHTFLEGKVQKRPSTLVSLWRNLRKICWGEPTVLQVWKEMGERKREGALNVFLQSYQDITGKERVWRGAALVWFQISPSKSLRSEREGLPKCFEDHFDPPLFSQLFFGHDQYSQFWFW